MDKIQKRGISHDLNSFKWPLLAVTFKKSVQFNLSLISSPHYFGSNYERRSFYGVFQTLAPFPKIPFKFKGPPTNNF